MVVSIPVVIALAAPVLVAIISFHGWLAIQVISLKNEVLRTNGKILEVEARVAAQDRRCDERLDWTRNIEATVNSSAKVIVAIATKLEVEHEGEVNNESTT